MLDDLSLFISIVESGSLGAAAEKEGLPSATVTRRLQALERDLGYQLLVRSARRMQLTSEGQLYYEQCRPLIHALRQAARRLDDVFGAISGNIRILAPTNLACGPLTQAWSGFMQKHPAVTLELELSNTLQDLVGKGADLAIRVGALNDSALVQRRLGESKIVLVAAPSYLEKAGCPRGAEALMQHELIVAEPLRQWKLRKPQENAEMVIRPQPRFRVDEMRLAVSMAEAGIGILLCPEIQCRASIESGRLVTLLPDWMPAPRQIYAVWPQQQYMPARVRALLDYLVEFVAASHLIRI